jgi:ABC-2 type transport system permease protein
LCIHNHPTARAEVDALRALLIGTAFNPADIAVLVVAAVLGIITASTLLRRLVS